MDYIKAELLTTGKTNKVWDFVLYSSAKRGG